MITALEYRPQFSARLIKLQDWYKPEKFQYIWGKARFDYWMKGSQSPAREFVWDIGVSQRTVRRWLGGSRPSRMAFHRLDLALISLWGEDWIEYIDQQMEDDNDD